MLYSDLYTENTQKKVQEIFTYGIMDGIGYS